MKRLLFTLIAITIGMTSWGQYCFPTYSNACTSGDYIDGFELNTIINNGTACSNPGANNFTDYTAMSTSLTQGQSYNVTCAPGTSWGQYFVVWIDFNQDLDFNDPNEFFDIGYAAGGSSVITNIAIPTGVLGGPTRLRVMCHFGSGAISQTDACSAQSWGEVEDYTVNISLPSPNEVATVSVDAPLSGCGLGMETVTATFQNNGTSVITALDVCYSSNGGTWVCDYLTGLSIASGATYQHNFTTLLDLSIPNDYYIDVSASLIGDTVSQNDTITGYFVQSIPTITGIPYSENFETGSGGWTSSGTASNWEHGVLNQTNIIGNGGCSVGDSMVWATGLATNYNNNAVAYLSSPCIDFSGLMVDPLLTFDHIFQVESGFEDHYVEVSIDGGLTWSVLGATGTGLNWYNQPTSWDGTSYASAGQWRKAGHVLTGTAGETDVRIRFVLTSDGSVQMEGIAIDNIKIDASSLLVDALPLSVDAPASGCGLTNAETISATYSNVGQDTLIGFDVCYSIDGGTPVCVTLGDTILPGGTFTYTFATTADFSTEGAYNVDLIISALDLDGCNDTMSNVIQNKPVISSYPYYETFENGPGGWESQNGANGTWELDTPAGNVIIGASSGQNAWVTNAAGNYNINDNSSVLGPCFDFTALPVGAYVGMKVWWNSEFSWDGANLQYSIDTATTWTNVGASGDPFNWYNDNSINGAPGGSQEGWSGRTSSGSGSNGWVSVQHPLDPSLVGVPHVLFRINFGSDGSVTDDGFAFDNFVIGVPPTVDLGADYVGCGNYPIDLGLPGTYQWFAEDTATFTSTPISTDPIGVFTNIFATDTTYNGILLYTDTIGLSGLDTIMLTLYPAPYNEFNDTTICSGDSIMFNVVANPWYTYSWNNGSSVDSSLFVYTTGGPVEVIVTDTNTGCVDTTTATIYQTPVVAPVDVSACEGDTAYIDATSAYATYSWSNGDTTSMAATTTAGYITVTATDNIGCVSVDSAMVTINPLPTPMITGSTDTICINYDLNLDAGAGFATYVWSTGGTLQAEPLTGSGLGNGSHVIVVSVTDGNGCSNSDTTTVFVDPCVGIDEITMDFNLFPNPSYGIFNYQIDGNYANGEIVVFDLLGKVIFQNRLTDKVGSIDLTNAAPGTYLLKVAQGDASTTIRLIKE